MISVKSFSSKVKSMNSSFITNMNIFDIFYHFPRFEHNKSEVWKGKNLCPWGVKLKIIQQYKLYGISYHLVWWFTKKSRTWKTSYRLKFIYCNGKEGCTHGNQASSCIVQFQRRLFFRRLFFLIAMCHLSALISRHIFLMEKFLPRICEKKIPQFANKGYVYD